LEPLRVIEANYIDKSADRLAVLTGAHVHEVFPLMDASLDKISIASYATELAREIARDNQPDDTLFALLVDHYRAVNALDDEPAALEFAVQCFVIRALAAAGVLPPMGACARCHTPADRGQSWRLVWNAGAICSDCRRPGDIATATQRHALLHLDAIARGAPGHGREAQRASRPLLLGLVRTLVGRDLKSTPFLHMVLS
jgi:recombinational DNA repair protein (RecF pathway)